MLLIDGVKYELWTPSTEDELEQIVKEHAQDVFGEQSIYLDMRQKLKSGVGTGSIPDGFVIVFGDSPHWRIVEVELSSHPLHDHIVAQVGRFISGIENPRTQNNIVNAIYDEITKDNFLKLRLQKSIGIVDIHRFLADLVSKLPILTIIIEKASLELSEALKILRYPQEIKVVEFQTFIRERVGLEVHAHLFEPLYPVFIRPPEEPVDEGEDTLEVVLESPSNINFHTIDVPKARRRFFPGYKIPFELETDIGIIQTWVSSAPGGTQRGDPDKGVYIQAKLAEWYRRHPMVKVGDKVVFKVIEQMKKYRLELLKGAKRGYLTTYPLNPPTRKGR